jgi:hypothetical protein
MRRRSLAATCLFAAGSLAAPHAARADEPSAEAVELPAPEAALAEPAPAAVQPYALAGDELERYALPPAESAGLTAVEDWQRRRPWRYGTQNLFPLTRGMAEAGIPPVARWPLYVLTVPFDTGHLFFGALGGLYGD